MVLSHSHLTNFVSRCSSSQPQPCCGHRRRWDNTHLCGTWAGIGFRLLQGFQKNEDYECQLHNGSVEVSHQLWHLHISLFLWSPCRQKILWVREQQYCHCFSQRYKCFQICKFARMKDIWNNNVVPFITLINLDLAIAPVLEITGPQKIYEGDQLFLTCSINTSLPNTTRADLSLKQGNKILNRGFPKVNHSLQVLDKDSADFTCLLYMRHVLKRTSKKISVSGELLRCVFIIVKWNFY